jgi:hypothetical protein
MKRLLLSAVLAAGGLAGGALVGSPAAQAGTCAPGRVCVDIPVQHCDTIIDNCTPEDIWIKPGSGHICVGREDQRTPGRGQAVCVDY